MSIPEIASEYDPAVPVDSLKRHPRNPRQGDIGAIGESIERHGFYSVIIAQRSTRYVLAGNHRLVAAQQHGATTVPVKWLDVDDEIATRIMLADNRLSDIASNDDAALSALLAELAQTDAGLAGLGYGPTDLDAMLAEQSEPLDLAKNEQIECPSCGERFVPGDTAEKRAVRKAWEARSDA